MGQYEKMRMAIRNSESVDGLGMLHENSSRKHPKVAYIYCIYILFDGETITENSKGQNFGLSFYEGNRSFRNSYESNIAEYFLLLQNYAF